MELQVSLSHTKCMRNAVLKVAQIREVNLTNKFTFDVRGSVFSLSPRNEWAQ